MADPKEPTRAELAEALINSNRLVAEMSKTLEAQNAAIAELKSPVRGATDLTGETLKEVLGLLKEVQGSKPQSQHYFGPPIKKTAYDGYVKATEACVVNMLMQDGDIHPVRYEQDAVFQIDVDQLWTDDPYVPVIMKGTDSAGVPITVPNENAVRADFRFRQHAQLMEGPELKRANKY